MRDMKFWLSMGAFQLAFGLAVFFLTRQYYLEAPVARTTPVDATLDATKNWLDEVSVANPATRQLPVTDPSGIDDPFELSRRADEYFSDKDYASAARYYERLLQIDPVNVDIYNNLGLTLHYLGRSTEAVAKLGQGIAIDPANQRIWLTLGFVNSQAGDIEEARRALARAVELAADTQVGQSAASMLESLPPPD
jgi:tetratricopeptide (TPR) repeat protein